MATEVRIEHRYPAGFGFVRDHGPNGLAVLHALLVSAVERDGELVVSVSIRDIAGQLGSVSKDTIYRQLRRLASAGVIERIDDSTGSRLASPTYVIHLSDIAISLNTTPRSRLNQTRH